MRVKVDLELCQGHALCREEAPEIFDVVERPGEYDQVKLLEERPPEALRAKALAAARHCPNRVITVEKTD
ncbi:MAG: ferredoxin [Myxococcota bacterium]